MNTEILYKDSQVICYGDRLEIQHYYFPLGSKKVVYYHEIKAWTEGKLDMMSGKFKLWGGNFAAGWLNADWKRFNKQKYLLLDTGEWIKPVITADEHERFVQVLKTKIDAILQIEN